MNDVITESRLPVSDACSRTIKPEIDLLCDLNKQLIQTFFRRTSCIVKNHTVHINCRLHLGNAFALCTIIYALMHTKTYCNKCLFVCKRFVPFRHAASLRCRYTSDCLQETPYGWYVPSGEGNNAKAGAVAFVLLCVPCSFCKRLQFNSLTRWLIHDYHWMPNGAALSLQTFEVYKCWEWGKKPAKGCVAQLVGRLKKIRHRLFSQQNLGKPDPSLPRIKALKHKLYWACQSK